VRIDVDNAGTDIWRFSDYNINFSIADETYVALGGLMSIGRTKTELAPSTNPVTITLSGVPNTAISDVLNARLKGSRVKIYRAFFDPDDGSQVGVTTMRYNGILKNYSIDEEYSVVDRTATNIISINIDSIVGYLNTKIVGRQTNPESMKTFYPTDKSFDRVPSIKNQAWDFGIVR
jgi:hypothetical protein